MGSEWPRDKSINEEREEDNRMLSEGVEQQMCKREVEERQMKMMIKTDTENDSHDRKRDEMS
jgi:hypothetical protein